MFDHFQNCIYYMDKKKTENEVRGAHYWECSRMHLGYDLANCKMVDVIINYLI